MTAIEAAGHSGDPAGQAEAALAPCGLRVAEVAGTVRLAVLAPSARGGRPLTPLVASRP